MRALNRLLWRAALLAWMMFLPALLSMSGTASLKALSAAAARPGGRVSWLGVSWPKGRLLVSGLKKGA
jgi:hypothetical protein